MLLSGFSSNKKSLLTQSIRGFANTICILAGSPSWDATGAKVMQQLKKISPEPIQFVGIGGPQMKAEGLEKNYADVNTFLNKPCMPYKNHLRAHILQPIHWVTGWIHAANRKVIKQLEQNQFPKDVLEANKPSLFLTVGNELFMRDVYQILNRSFKARGILKPPMFHYDKLLINQRIEYTYYCDHWLYTNPREPVNWRYYKYPSTFVGPWPVARALEYLYSTSPQHKTLLSDNTLYISKEYNHEIVDSLIQAERVRFRQKHGIEDSTTLFYALPGNIPSEINWAVPLIHGTVTEFLKKFNQFTPDNFAIVIPSDPAIEKDVVAAVNKFKWPIKIVVTKDANEKYSGLAACDMAAVVDGDAVSECAAYQVPCVVLNQQKFFQSYATLLYNSFSNDLNIALNGEAYPETLGMCFPSKVVEFWGKWFTDPKSRYGAVQRFENLVPRLAAQVSNQIEDPVAVEGTQLVKENHMEFSKYYFSEYLAAQKILQAKDIYYRTAQRNVPAFELDKTRQEMLKQINLA